MVSTNQFNSDPGEQIFFPTQTYHPSKGTVPKTYKVLNNSCWMEGRKKRKKKEEGESGVKVGKHKDDEREGKMGVGVTERVRGVPLPFYHL